MLSKVSLMILASAIASTYAAPQGVTSRLDASGSISSCRASFPSSFGIAIMEANATATNTGAARVTQVGDGQPQGATGAATIVSQISDGQPQAATSGGAAVSQVGDNQGQAAATTGAPVVSQIGDGQPQVASTGAQVTVVSQIGDGQPQVPTHGVAKVITQIGDGQVQAPMTAQAAPTPATMKVITQIGDGQVQAPTAAAKPVVSQIGDGQIQAPTSVGSVGAAAPVSQIGDGQIQAPTATSAAVVSQIGDGQVQAPTSTPLQSATAVSQIGDGQIQAPTASTLATVRGGRNSVKKASFDMSYVCSEPNSTLTLSLQDGILKDNQGRQGYIASNRQFQFDMPIQAGALITAGFGACSNGSLSLGGSTLFYQCLSGDFYNLYDQSQGGQCEPVELEMVNLMDC